MPLQQPEAEQYCFGPGEPRLSTVRMSVPIGINGAPAVIRTSVIPEAENAPNRIPFLAGQDWLVMMKAVIDLGNNKLLLRLIDREVPLYVDTTGHLVIAIDEYGPDGWPQGLTTRVDKYPGAIFATTAGHGENVELQGIGQKGESLDVRSPNYFYEPNDDNMNDSLPQGPCFVGTDYWEYTHDGMIIRHHRRPRQQLFDPSEVPDGPDPQTLHSVRLTLWSDSQVKGQHYDCWRAPQNEFTGPLQWHGKTVFFLTDVDPKHVRVQPLHEFGVLVEFADGVKKEVSHASLRPLPIHKKIQQFDLAAVTPLFEHASTRKRVSFQVPPGQFGSSDSMHPHLESQHPGQLRVHDHPERRHECPSGHEEQSSQLRRQRRGGQAAQDRQLRDGVQPTAPQEDELVATLGPHDAKDQRPLAGSDPLASHQVRDDRVAAPISGPDQLHVRHGGRSKGTKDTEAYIADFFNSSSGSDEEASAAVPRPPCSLPPRGRGCTPVRESTGQVHGVLELRPGEEGAARGLHHPDQQHAGGRLRDGSWHKEPSRRKGGLNSQGLSKGIGQLGKLLLTFLCAGFCAIGSTPNEWLPDYAQEGSKGSFPFLSEFEPGLGTGRSGGPADGGRLSNAQPLRQGIRKRLKHSARRALQTSKTARDVMAQKAASSRWPRKRFGYDIVEIFGGTSMISIRAGKVWGLRVLQPIDIRFGINLRQRSARRWLMRTLDKLNPRLAVVEFPCTPWSILQRNVNYKDDPEGLIHLQEEDRPFLKLTEQIFESQRRRGGHALAENPATADSQVQPEIMRLREKYYETTSCMCRFGMVGRHGLPMKKRVRWIGTHPLFMHHLDKQCRGDHLHEAVAGSNTGKSAEYPPALADTIVRAYLEVVAEEDFGTHFDWQPDERDVRSAHYVDVVREEDKWRPLLDQAGEILALRLAPSCFIDTTSDLYQKIATLVPWQIVNVQVAYLPKAKRLRPGLEQCHRCSVLLQNDGDVLIETEHLPTAQAPRERFIKPIRVGIFIHGYAPGEPQAPAPAKQIAPVPEPPPDGEVIDDPFDPGGDPDGQDPDEAGRGRVRQDYGGEIWFIGPPLRHEQRRLAPSLVRMHRNLGHPRTEDFVRALAQHGKVDPEAISLARRLRCASCERTRKPLPPRPTSLKAVGSFNDKVCLDFVFLHDANEVKHTYLHVLDPAGGFNVFAWVPGRKPEDVFEAFNNIWLSWAGYPKTMWLDQDGGFQGEFLERLQQGGTDVDHPAAEAHWQAGEVESFNRAFRYVANRIIDEKQLTGEADMKMLGSLVGASLNDKVRASGASANQWVFGRSPRMPTDILSTDGQIEAVQGLQQDEQLRLRNYIRAQADAAIAQYRTEEALRVAVQRQGRPTRQSYEPGELIAFWRDVKKRKGKILQPGWFRGTVVGPHRGDDSPQQSNYWIASGGKLILVSKEQMRPTYGTERWQIDEETLQDILDDCPEEYFDETGDPPPEDEILPEREQVVVPMHDIPAFDPGDDYSPEVLPPEVPRASGDPPSTAPSRATDTTQPPTSMRMREDRLPGTPVHGLLPQPMTPPPELLDLGIAQPDAKRADDEHQPGGDAKRLRTEATGSEPPEEVAPFNSYPENEDIPTFDTEASAVAHGVLWGVRVQREGVQVRNVSNTRKEQKALEKELPWHMIPPEELNGYLAALQKEWDTWCKYQAVNVLDLEASKYVEEHVPRERILSTRVCYRNKNAAYPWLPVKHKARLVCRGDMDPDLLTLRRDAPTMTRLSLMVICQIAASMSGWFMFNADITGAFLQGDQSLASRKQALYLRQPTEGLPGLVKGQLMLVVRGIFGLANSPRLFWRHLRDTLLKKGFVQSVLDKAVFMYYRNKKLVLVLGAHVDDLIGTGHPQEADEILTELRATFDFGAWADSRTDKVLEYGGKQLSFEDIDGQKVVCLSQKKFIQAASATVIPKWRMATPNSPLTPSEHTELRSIGGSLHWMTGQTRPDLAAGTSLHMAGQPTVDHLIQLNKLIKEAKASEDWCLRFRPIPLETAKVLVFSDSSWANTDELKSQAGFMVLFAGCQVDTLGGDFVSLLDWRSHRIKRKCRSTLAAETMALDAGVDAGIYARELMAEILVESYNPVHSGRLPSTNFPVLAVTDCRSLFDLLVKDGPVSTTQEKRLAIDLGGLKEAATEFDESQEQLTDIFKWVPTGEQWADHLTKIKPSWILRQLLDIGRFALKKAASVDQSRRSSPVKILGSAAFECIHHVKT